LNLKRWKHFS